MFRGIEDLRSAMNAVGLEARGRIGTLTGVVQEKLVANTGRNINIIDNRVEVSVAVGVQGLGARIGSSEHHGDLLATRSPDAKRNSATSQVDRAWPVFRLRLRKGGECQVQVSLLG